MFFRICFWFCGIIFDTPTIEKIIFLSSTVAINSFVCFVGKDNENNSYWQIKTEGKEWTRKQGDELTRYLQKEDKVRGRQSNRKTKDRVTEETKR